MIYYTSFLKIRNPDPLDRLQEFDDIFDVDVLDAILNEFEEPEDQWSKFETKYEYKFQADSDISFGPVTRAFIHNLNSEPFLIFLEK